MTPRIEERFEREILIMDMNGRIFVPLKINFFKKYWLLTRKKSTASI